MKDSMEDMFERRVRSQENAQILHGIAFFTAVGVLGG
jgi:hypothetical protein